MTEKLFQTSEIKHLFDILNDGHFCVRVYIFCLWKQKSYTFIKEKEQASL